MLLAIENPEKFLIIFIALAISAIIMRPFSALANVCNEIHLCSPAPGGFLFARHLPAIYTAMAR